VTQHLGDRLAALVDGELGHDARDRALSHIAYCPTCRAALDAERLAKARVTDAAAPAPSGDLTRRLLELAEPGEPLYPQPPAMPGGALRPPVLRRPGARRAVRSGPGRAAHPANSAGRPAHRGRAGGRARRTGLAAAGAMSVLVVALGSAFALGGQGDTRPVLPPIEQFSVEHVTITQQMPMADPALGVVTATFGEVSSQEEAPQ
jgi:anti-sigma factor RsiW